MGQYFDYDPNRRSTLLRAAAAHAFCVVVDGNQNVNGAKVQLWECDHSVPAQHWIFHSHGSQGMLLKNAAFPSKCLVVDGNQGHNGAKLQVWDCSVSMYYNGWKAYH